MSDCFINNENTDIEKVGCVNENFSRINMTCSPNNYFLF